MYEPHPDDMTQLATRSEAVREWAWNYGAPSHVAWLLHDWDVWVKNPHYIGPAVPHPEDDVEDHYFTDDERPVSYWENYPYIRVRSWEQYNVG